MRNSGKLKDDVDELYKLPLAEFVDARNSLARQLKQSGRAGDANIVKKLVKTSISAWTVNQLYWNYREEFEMLLAAGVERSASAARDKLEHALDSGLAAEKFERLIAAQGGNHAVVENPELLPQAQAVEIFAAPETGVVTRVDPRSIGRAVVALGGGRRRVDDAIDPSVGFVITVKPGDRVVAGEPIASIYARDADGARQGCAALASAVAIGDRLQEPPLPLVSHRVTKDAVETVAKDARPPRSLP